MKHTHLLTIFFVTIWSLTIIATPPKNVHRYSFINNTAINFTGYRLLSEFNAIDEKGNVITWSQYIQPNDHYYLDYQNGYCLTHAKFTPVSSTGFGDYPIKPPLSIDLDKSHCDLKNSYTIIPIEITKDTKDITIPRDGLLVTYNIINTTQAQLNPIKLLTTMNWGGKEEADFLYSYPEIWAEGPGTVTVLTPDACIKKAQITALLPSRSVDIDVPNRFEGGCYTLEPVSNLRITALEGSLKAEWSKEEGDTL